MNSGRGEAEAVFRQIFHARLSLKESNVAKPVKYVIGLPYLGSLGVAALLGHDFLKRCRVESDGSKWTLCPLQS